MLKYVYFSFIFLKGERNISISWSKVLNKPLILMHGGLNTHVFKMAVMDVTIL